METIKTAFILFTLCIFSGCAPIYVQSTSPSAAIIQNSESNDGMECNLASVDNIKIASFDDKKNGLFSLEPDKREIVAVGKNVSGEARVTMNVDLKPSIKYFLKCAKYGEYVRVWLENATTGKRASESFKAMYIQEPINTFHAADHYYRDLPIDNTKQAPQINLTPPTNPYIAPSFQAPSYQNSGQFLNSIINGGGFK